MVCICIALMLLGAVCLAVEIFIPGFGVFGLGGIACLIISAVLAVLYVPMGWAMVATEIILVGALVYFLFRWVKRRQLQGDIIMNEALREDTPEVYDLDSLVGKTGTAATALRPSGEIAIGGVRLEALSEGTIIIEGTRVKVIRVSNNKLIVQEEKNHANSN